jgi:hypothetical protein
MIGQRVESRPAPTWFAILLVCVGVAAITAAPATGKSWPAIAAALPLAIGVSLLVMGRDRPFAATFTAETIEVEDPPASVRFDQMLHVRAGGRAEHPHTFRRSTCTIDVQHEGGTLRIPGRLDHPSRDVYAFLAEQVPTQGGRDINPLLSEYLERQEAFFGAEQVWTYTMERQRRRSSGYRRLRSFCVGVMLAAVVWMVVGFSGVAYIGWGAAGLVAAVAAGIFFLASFVSNAPLYQSGRKLKGSSLVIGPQGMAMVQGEIQGEIRWPEVLEVRYGFNPWSPNSKRNPAGGLPMIRLRVKGAEIQILDIYDRPLYVIYDRIMACSGLDRRRGEDAPL